jgi:hypothetical protein
MEVNSIEELSFQLTSIWLQIKALEAFSASTHCNKVWFGKHRENNKLRSFICSCLNYTTSMGYVTSLVRYHCNLAQSDLVLHMAHQRHKQLVEKTSKILLPEQESILSSLYTSITCQWNPHHHSCASISTECEFTKDINMASSSKHISM